MSHLVALGHQFATFPTRQNSTPRDGAKVPHARAEPRTSGRHRAIHGKRGKRLAHQVIRYASCATSAAQAAKARQPSAAVSGMQKIE